MNRSQGLALAVGALNIVLVLLFPPYDQFSLAGARVPSFAGFYFALGPKPPASALNQGLLIIELIVILANVGIAWLLLGGGRRASARVGLQTATLLFVALNLVLILLFPPFQFVHAVTGAALPSFDGFYFIFAANPNLTLVSPILYIEVFFVLINGGLVYLTFRPRRTHGVSTADMSRLAREIQGDAKR